MADTGEKAVKASLRRMRRRYPDAVAAALYREGQRVARDAFPRTPVEFGFLRGSLYVAPPTSKTVEIGYGKDYAVPVHERVELRHRVGEAKFLKNAIDATAVGRWQRVLTDAKQLLNSGRSYGQGFDGEFPTSPMNRGR